MNDKLQDLLSEIIELQEMIRIYEESEDGIHWLSLEQTYWHYRAIQDKQTTAKQ